MPSSLTRGVFASFSRLRVTRDAAIAAEAGVSRFMAQLGADLATLARHAQRRSVEIGDFELLMRRQRIVTPARSLLDVVHEHLPLELAEAVLPVARIGNRIEPD